MKQAKTAVALSMMVGQILWAFAPLIAQGIVPEDRRAEISAGLQWKGESAEPSLYLEASAFHGFIPMDRPDFFDIGGKISWLDGEWGIGIGARHKLYFVSLSSLDQEVLLTYKTNQQGQSFLGLTGSFGGGLPFNLVDNPYPAGAANLDLVWGLLWRLPDFAFVTRLGFTIGVSGNAGL